MGLPFLATASAVILALGVLVPTMPIMAATQSSNNAEPQPVQIDDKWLEENQPKRLSDAELEEAKEIALADSQIQKIIDGQPHKFIAVNYVADASKTPVEWMVDIHYNIDNKQQLGILIDMASKEVIKSEVIDFDAINDINEDPVYAEYKAKHGVDPNGYAIARLTGTPVAPKRIEGFFTAPTFTNTVDPGVGNVLLVNAQRTGASAGNACDPAYTSDRYWAQAGLYWRTFGRVNYDDTSTGCSPVFPTGITYQPGYNYNFKIYGRTTGWQIAMIGPGPVVVNYYGPAINTDTMQTSDSRTSIFFENKVLQGTNWASQFGSNPTTNNARYGKTTISVDPWPSDVRYDQNCGGTQFNYPYGSHEVINNSLTNYAFAAFSVSNMQSYYYRC